MTENNCSHICLDKFWDRNLTWDTPNPDFTQCFQQFILVILPCLIFWLAALIHLCINIKERRNIPLPWTPLNILKLGLAVVILCISIVQAVLAFYQKYKDMDIAESEVYASCIKAVTFVLVIIVILRNRVTGIHSSTLLALFWLGMTVCSIFLFRSTIMRAFLKEFSPISKYKYIPEMAYFPVLFIIFILSFFPDKTTGTPLEGKNPFETATFYSFITFHWFNGLIMKGRNTLLSLEDFPPIPSKLDARYLWKTFEVCWSKELIRYRAKLEHSPDKTIKPRLAWTIFKSLWPWIVAASILQVLHNFTVFISPLLLDQLLTFIATNEYTWKGYLFSISICAAEILSYFMFGHMWNYSQCFALQLQSAITSAVYRKSLKLSSSARKNYPTGEIVNLISVDVDKMYEFSTICTFAFGAPIKILLTIGFLWVYLGPSCLSGIAILIIMIVFSTLVSKKVNALQERQMETKDARLKFMTEILNGIKVLKLYAWENPFMKKITDIRIKEVHLIRSFQLFYAVFSFVWGSAAFMVAIASFVTYILVNQNHVLDPNTVFVSLNLLNILRYAVLEVPQLIADTIQTIVSVKRVATFLSSEERIEDEIGNSPNPGDVISVKNVNMTWDIENEPILKDIDLHVSQGSLVVVIGPVGSGKSSLISAILGEMYKLSGTIDLQGEIAYVPQQAWILNKTVKENIIFVNSMNRTKYNNVLEACCLKSDLEILPAGDDTEIGEKGVNMSGGQKQRVSIARAVYHNADIYLLDDPLSAVDAHVSKHIFDHVIGKNGLLKNKTKLLVTHNISILPEADLIITMKDGRIEETGTYEQLLNQQKFFYELIQEYSNVKENNTDGVCESPTTPDPNIGRRFSLRSISVQSVERQISSDSKGKTDAMGRLTEDERMEVGEVKRTALITYAKHMGFAIILSVCFGYIGNQACDIGGNIWLSEWSNDKLPVNGTQDLAWRNTRIGVYAALGFGQSALVVFGSVSVALGSARAAKLFHVNMLKSVMHAPMSFFDTTPLGRILNRFGRDIEDIDTGIPSQIDAVCYCIFAALGTIVLIGSKIPLFLPFLIPLFIVLYLIQKLYLKTSRQLKRISSTTRSPVYSHLTESFQGASSINAFRVSDYFIEKAEEKMNTNCLSQFMWNICSRWLDIRLAVLGNLITLLTAILGVTSKNYLNAAVVGLTITYAISVNDIIGFLIRCFTDLENKLVAVERVLDYSTLDSEAAWERDENAPPPEWPPSGKIEFKSYSTRYRENLDLVLNNIDLSISEHEKVGVVGRTGAGKSSFALALFRIIEPVTGTIDIDEINVSELGLHNLRSKLTIIPQDPVLFTGSLRINLDPNEEYTDDEVWLSLEHSNLKTYVSSLADGLAHEVTEGGSNLSVGQRQLVCLARALLKKTKILILDEATAAVDVETDSLIQNTIRTEFKDHTVITIAHRLNTIVDYDKVIVMESGQIAEVGKPSDLLNKPKSRFYKMAKDAGLV